MQSRDGLIDRYGEAFAHDLQQQAEAVQAWKITDEDTLKRLEYLSGKTSVVVWSINAAGGAVQTASFGVSEHARPLLQVEDITRMRADQQLLLVPGAPPFIADLISYPDIEEISGCIGDPRRITPDTVIPPFGLPRSSAP